MVPAARATSDDDTDCVTYNSREPGKPEIAMPSADTASVNTVADTPVKKQSWGEALESFLHPRVVTMLFLGFSAGIPILLIFSSLSLWLTEAGVKKSAVTFFSWAALGYSFKFICAPLVDRLPLPLLTCLLYTSPSPRDQRGSRMPSSA